MQMPGTPSPTLLIFLPVTSQSVRVDAPADADVIIKFYDIDRFSFSFSSAHFLLAVRTPLVDASLKIHALSAFLKEIMEQELTMSVF